MSSSASTRGSREVLGDRVLVLEEQAVLSGARDTVQLDAGRQHDVACRDRVLDAGR